MARYLLSRRADPNLGRALISAINREPEELGLKFVILLVEYGADVNLVFPWFDSEKVTFTPLTWAIANGKTTIVEFLRAHGAVVPEKPAADKAVPRNLAEEVVDYFQEHFGRVRPVELIEIVPVGQPIAVHCVPSDESRNHITLFTTGLSDQEMIAPKGSEDYRFAELFIQLPESWPLDEEALSDVNTGWPIHWLRKIAKYPHLNKTWLGGPATIIANEDPPNPLAPNMRFTCWLLLAEKCLTSRDGRRIQFYRLMPLYTEERELEMKQGIAALLRAFDEESVPFVVDLQRPNVGKEPKGKGGK